MEATAAGLVDGNVLDQDDVDVKVDIGYGRSVNKRSIGGAISYSGATVELTKNGKTKFAEAATKDRQISLLNNVTSGNKEKGDYTPTWQERIARWGNYTHPAGITINAMNDAMSILTGQERHSYGPDAVIFTKSVEGGVIVGGTAGAGFIVILRRGQKGMYALGDLWSRIITH